MAQRLGDQRKLDRAYQAVRRSFPQSSSHRRVQEVLTETAIEYGFGEKLGAEFRQMVLDAELRLKWRSRSRGKIYSFQKPVHPIEVAMAFSNRAYICNATALYWNSITDQVPTTYYVALERATRTHPQQDEEVDQYYLEEQFMKPYRSTELYADYEGIRYVLLERDATGLLGVTKRKLQVDARALRYACTNIERTLIDCAVHPNRSGGLPTVLEGYREAKSRFTTRRMAALYVAMDFTYPYWQRIGFLLSRAGQRKKAADWRQHFGEPTLDFYADKPFRSDWPFDPDWRVHFPPGLPN